MRRHIYDEDDEGKVLFGRTRDAWRTKRRIEFFGSPEKKALEAAKKEKNKKTNEEMARHYIAFDSKDRFPESIVKRYADAFDCVKGMIKEDNQIELGINYAHALSEVIKKKFKFVCETYPNSKAAHKERLLTLYKWCFALCAPYRLDDFMLAVEYGRPPKERFYMPRRKTLKPIVDAMQALSDGELDELFISMPPRVGKSTLCLFYMIWEICRNPERSNLYVAYSNTITEAFYNGVNEIINDNFTYSLAKIFPDATVPDGGRNAKLGTLDIGRAKRYHSLTSRSLYGTLNGACDCNGVLMADDLIGGIEEALNPDRMRSAWSKVDNNMIPRAKEQAKIIWVGTRWSLIDPIGLRLELLQNDPAYKNRRFKVFNIPALNSNDESNFFYDYEVGYSTDFYKQRRASFERNNDIASWLAQYMGQPIEREGALFTPDTMQFYNGVLPEGKPDRVFTHVDVAFGGGDYVSAPICYEYGDKVFVHDVVFNDGDKRETQPLLVNKLIYHNVNAANFEANNGGEGYKDDIDNMLREKGYRMNITSRKADNQKRKEIRIFDKAPEIREFYYLEDGKRSPEYSVFMTNLYSFKMFGKNKHDDAPDSLAGCAEMHNGAHVNSVEVFKRAF